MWVLGSESGSLQEEQTLSTATPPLQSKLKTFEELLSDFPNL